MALDQTVFERQYGVFKERIARKSGRPFVSFDEGLPLEWEGYKEPLRRKALGRLSAENWQRNSVGRGEILKSLISAIEIPPEGKDESNNLVRWRNEYGHRNRSHYVLLDAQTDPALRSEIESWAFSFYCGEEEPGAAFEQIRAIVGSRYDLVAYLFFLSLTES
ncbi:MAG: hypothetical protein WA633_17455 [Stellaceae bacterium]